MTKFEFVVAFILYSVIILICGELSLQSKLEKACRGNGILSIHNENYVFTECSIKQIYH